MAIKHDTTLEQVPTGPKGNPEGIATCPSPNRDEVNQRGGGKAVVWWEGCGAAPAKLRKFRAPAVPGR